MWTANHRPLEHLVGVDLIYLNESRGALLMVQYEMMEPQPGRKDRRGQRLIVRAPQGA
ncbi:hypothetical protein NKG60_28360 [Mesorhizobium sp. M1428]|uniref:hypothetical protein n=1 Tax=Mesorhizobium sp. M1428 TaxID=2957102 RepID=UPI00333E03AF